MPHLSLSLSLQESRSLFRIVIPFSVSLPPSPSLSSKQDHWGDLHGEHGEDAGAAPHVHHDLVAEAMRVVYDRVPVSARGPAVRNLSDVDYSCIKLVDTLVHVSQYPPDPQKPRLFLG